MDGLSWGVVLTAIVTAASELGKSAAGELGKSAITDAYDKVKTLIQDKLGEKSTVNAAIKLVDDAPEDEDYKKALKKALEKEDANLDDPIVQAAHQLLEAIQPDQSKYRELIQNTVNQYVVNPVRSNIAARDININNQWFGQFLMAKAQ